MAARKYGGPFYSRKNLQVGQAALNPHSYATTEVYFFGLDPKRGKKKLKASADLHYGVLENTETPASEAIKSFFEAHSSS
jgi:hypothetical protein